MSDAITCPICDATSYHPVDILQGYCGRCHAFTTRRAPDFDSEACDRYPVAALRGVQDIVGRSTVWRWLLLGPTVLYLLPASPGSGDHLWTLAGWQTAAGCDHHASRIISTTFTTRHTRPHGDLLANFRAGITRYRSGETRLRL